MQDRLDELLKSVVPPDADPVFVERLRWLPLPARRRSFSVWEWLAYLVPLPAAAAVAGFAFGVLTTSAPLPNRQAIAFTELVGGRADAVAVELMEDILWPYDSPITLASY